ncbi:MAG: hypothetical protein ACLP3K_00475 [Candidatus Acidiferrales bacterium]
MIVLEPSDSTESSTLEFRPLTTAPITMIVLTPIMMPRTVRNERSGFRTTMSSASVSDSLKSPDQGALNTTVPSSTYLNARSGYFVSPFPFCSGMETSTLVSFMMCKRSSISLGVFTGKTISVSAKSTLANLPFRNMNPPARGWAVAGCEQAQLARNGIGMN